MKTKLTNAVSETTRPSRTIGASRRSGPQAARRMRRSAAAVVLLLMGSASASAWAASAKKVYELGYFVPRGRAGATVADRLIECPTESSDPKFQTALTVAGKLVPDPDGFIKVDARKGLLAKRTTELKLRPDGTLEAFNASNEGQGGLVLSALIKVGASLATGGIAGAIAESPPPFDCTDEAKADLAEYERLRQDIIAAEGVMASEEANPATASELALRRAELQEVANRLTVTSRAPRIDPSPGTTEGVGYIEPTDISRFFKLEQPGAANAFALYLAKRPGRFGYGVGWKADKALATALATGRDKPLKATPGLYYRRPVPATVAVHSCASKPAAATKLCAADETPRGKALSADGTVSFPQLSGYFTIPIGRGGLFGSEEAAAEFDATGAPTRLKYGSDAGAAAIAGVIDTARGAYVALEKAPAAAQQAELDELKRRKEIRELEHALSKPLPD